MLATSAGGRIREQWRDRGRPGELAERLAHCVVAYVAGLGRQVHGQID
jgi:hypothetical protein